MNEKELVSALNATGKECFVYYLEYFINSMLSNEKIASIMQRERGYTHNSCRSRTSKARSILKNNRLKDALQIIIEADRVDYECRKKARELLSKINPLSSQNFANKAILKTNSVKFKDLSSTVEKELTIILGKICHHIHPEIVNYIAKENLTYKSEFESICHRSCTIHSFFYKHSDCIFPGFRRPINKEKEGKWKNNVFDIDGTILNDNTFPRHIWAYLAENKAYSGGSSGMWSSSGLAKFELAHIFAHKQDEREIETEVFKLLTEKTEPYGLFTSASNTVLIPKGYAKPTDNMKSVKICFYKRHLELYGNNIIGLSNFNESIVPSWYAEINWLQPILPDDWQVRIDNLLSYRKKYLRRKYRSHAKAI